jgi:hypothetical protein
VARGDNAARRGSAAGRGGAAAGGRLKGWSSSARARSTARTGAAGW